METKKETVYSLISATGNPEEQNVPSPRGQRLITAASAAIASFILIMNIVVLIWSATTFGIHDGTATVYTGSLSEVKRISTWSHLGINVLSTILLAASNSCMQRLNAPTRGDVDMAHNKGQHLDIGVLGIRNFKFISSTRTWLWLILALSSVPLHLVYNSVIYETISPNDYLYTVVSSDFFSGATWNTTFWAQWLDSTGEEPVNLSYLLDLQAHPSTLIKLDTAECIQAYARDFVINSRTLFMVTNFTSPSDSMFAITSYETLGGVGGVTSQSSWACSSQSQDAVVCDVNNAVASANGWLQEAILNYPNGTSTLVENALVEYCMVEPVQENSSLGISTSILILVIVFNLIKLVCFLITPRAIKGEPLLTVGDAIVSFLDHPDPTTKGYSTLSAHDVKAGRWKPTTSQDNLYTEPVLWEGKRYFWFRSASTRRWIICSLLVMSILLAGLIVLLLGMHSLAQLGNGSSSSFTIPMSTLVEIGFGSISEHDLLGGLYPFQTSLVGAAVIANLPQLAASGLYLMYNGLFTCMLTAKEWTAFAAAHRFIRVSRPIQGSGQRGTLYLQLPYKYSVPIMIGSALLHWLLSQSLFISRLQIRGLEDFGINDPDRLFTGIGWSPLPLIVVLILGGIMMLGLFSMGCRKFIGIIPLTGHCSVAISAACKRKQGEEEVTLKKIRWGVIGFQEGGIGYAGFSGDLVEPLVAGKSYH